MAINWRTRVGTAVVSVLTGVTAAMAQSPFATTVIDYDPAPGQFVQDFLFNDPVWALGAPVAGGTSDGNEDSIVTLGGFGGSLTLGFDHRVMDDPLNPLGMDFIVFGNAFWIAGDPERHFAECATIEISRDDNGNGLPDDVWFLIPGSHVVDPVMQFESQTWDDDTGDAMFPPPFETWIPLGRSGMWTTSGYALPNATFAPPSQVVINPTGDGVNEGIYGYAEYTPTLLLGDLDADDVVDDPSITEAAFYTVPDDPFVVGITPGSGGGDAFDIAWAIDQTTGVPGNLDGFDFIRITTAVNADQGILGEVSAEIDAVADVAPGEPVSDIPAVSDWGVVILCLMFLSVGTILVRADVPRARGAK